MYIIVVRRLDSKKFHTIITFMILFFFFKLNLFEHAFTKMKSALNVNSVQEKNNNLA